MIVLQKLRELDMLPYTDGASGIHLSAASGLVIAGRYFYVVADDELHLGQFLLDTPCAGRWIRLFEGHLPHEKSARKAVKPDLEALALLPPGNRFPEGALLAIGSGSKKKRHHAVIMQLDGQGNLTAEHEKFSLKVLYKELQTRFPDLNIEGAFIKDEYLVLMQRANKHYRNSALVYCPLNLFLSLRDEEPADFSLSLSIVEYTLPEVDGIPLGFTDGTVLHDGRILFTAAAENTNDSYNDGTCAGSAIGVIAVDGQLQSCHLLQEPHKIEGIAVLADNDSLDIMLVSDADNALIPASLFRVSNARDIIA